jgi:hypothetical protein
VITNDVLKNALRFTGRLSVLASEEEDEPVSLENLEQIYKSQRRADVVVEEGNKVKEEGKESWTGTGGFMAGLLAFVCACCLCGLLLHQESDAKTGVCLSDASTTMTNMRVAQKPVRGRVRPAGRLEQRGRLHPRRHHLRHVSNPHHPFPNPIYNINEPTNPPTHHPTNS